MHCQHCQIRRQLPFSIALSPLQFGVLVRGGVVWPQHAAAELAEARKLSDRYSSIASLTAAEREYLASPKNRASAETTYLAGLRLAGMPEE